MNKKSIKELISLINILDSYEAFKKDLELLIKVEYNRDIISDLYNISMGNHLIGRRKIKDFYKKYKDIIDVVNGVMPISIFINSNYNAKGELYTNSPLNYYYKYFLKHKEELPQILRVLLKLKNLGFKEITLDENINYTENIYNYSTSYPIFNYLENIKIIPNYQDHIIKYTTTSSNYCIIINCDLFLNSYRLEISLNSLTFDPSKLPDIIDYDLLVNELLNLNNKEKENNIALKNAIDLEVGIRDFEQGYNSLNNLFSKLTEVKDPLEVKKILLTINKCLYKLKLISRNYNTRITKNNSSLTKEIIAKEQELYLRRRFEDYDFD